MAKASTKAEGAKKAKPGLVEQAAKDAAPKVKKTIRRAVKAAVKPAAKRRPALRKKLVTKAKPKAKMGRPKWDPTPAERRMVKRLVAAGMTRPQIAELLDKSEDSLKRHCSRELNIGDVEANAKVSGALFKKALKGDVGAMVWWEKTRRGLSEKSIVEHQGRAGGPIETRSLTAKEAADRYREKLG